MQIGFNKSWKLCLNLWLWRPLKPKFNLLSTQRHWGTDYFRKKIEKKHLLRHNFALHFTPYLSIALSKILPHSKTIKSAKKLSVFGENNTSRLSNFLQTHIFWKFDHICRICNQVNYRNIWLTRAAKILVMMAQVLFSNIFSEKDSYLNSIEELYSLRIMTVKMLFGDDCMNCNISFLKHLRKAFRISYTFV